MFLKMSSSGTSWGTSGTTACFIEAVAESQGEITAHELTPAVEYIGGVYRGGEIAVPIQDVIDCEASFSAVFQESVRECSAKQIVVQVGGFRAVVIIILVRGV